MDELLIGLAALLLLGVGAQWVAWRLRLPGILLLLGMGLFAGPEWLGWIHPDRLLGDLLFPVVSASVAVILFEGGLGLRIADLSAHGRVVARLCTVGAAVTWGLSTVFAHTLAGFDWGLATLLGAVVVVSGPTVVLPLLKHIHPRGPTGPILRWEGILIDPVGALLALLVYEGLLGPSLGAATSNGLLAILRTLAIGGVGGVLGGLLLVQALKRYWIPDALHSAATLALVVGIFALTNSLQHECGLLAVTVMGIVAANQRDVSVRHILEFKENLRVLLISGLFLLLAARVTKADLALLDTGAFLFLGALLFIVRPLTVLASTVGSDLAFKDRLFLAWLCPRGIVAAAVASIFGLELVRQGFAGAERLVPLTFLVIVGTVVVYGLTAGPLARRLGLAVANPQGLLVVGAHAWARELARACREVGIHVVLADTNRSHVRQARLDGLTAWQDDVLEEHALDDLDLGGIGHVLAVTPNDDVNHLIAQHFRHEFGSQRTFVLARDRLATRQPEASQAGRTLFGSEMDFYALSGRLARQGRVRSTTLSDQFDYEALLAHHGAHAVPLLAVAPGGTVTIHATDQPFRPSVGSTVLALVEAPEPSPSPRDRGDPRGPADAGEDPGGGAGAGESSSTGV
jgi:NhaP-type Na+/H+ or K+/H+ antiporter